MPLSGLVYIIRLLQLLSPVLAYRLEQPVSCLGLFIYQDDRLLYQARQQIQNILLLDAPSGAHRLGGLQREAAGEHRQASEEGFSHALLGIFDAIAPAASAALQALDAGDTDRYDEILAPTVPLSRHIFQTPTRFYKTGVVFLAYINGHQDHFRMVGGQESARSVTHLSELFVLADRAGLLHDPDLAAERMRRVLSVAGVS